MMILDIKYSLKPDLNFRWNHLSAEKNVIIDDKDF